MSVYQPCYPEFGAMVRQRREVLGLDQDYLARLLDLTRTSIANIEAGRQRVLLHHVLLIEGGLNFRFVERLTRPLVRLDVEWPAPQPHADSEE